MAAKHIAMEKRKASGYCDKAPPTEFDNLKVTLTPVGRFSAQVAAVNVVRSAPQEVNACKRNVLVVLTRNNEMS